MAEKTCSKCGVVYPLDAEHFNWKRKALGQFKSICKECQKKQKREWYEKNVLHVKEYNAKYRAENADAYAEYNRRNAKRYRLEHYEQSLSRERQYRSSHKTELYAYHKRRMETDELYRLSHNIRVEIRRAFRFGGIAKDQSTESIIGMPIEQFRKYLLSTYENVYGEPWDGKEPVHIDHILPLSTALTKDDIYRLNQYPNLRLIKASDNLKKGARLNYKIERR